jgi:arylsulfatase
MFGNLGIYHDGWIAATTPLVFAWLPEPKGLTPESFNWELYNLNKDFSQGNDLAKVMPDKLKQMQKLWWSEAAHCDCSRFDFEAADLGIRRANFGIRCIDSKTGARFVD